MGILTESFDEYLGRYAPRVAVADRHGPLTYAELDERAFAATGSLLAWWRQAGPEFSGEPPRILLYAANSAAYVAAYIGVLRAGAVPLLVDPALGALEVEGIVAGCGIDAVLYDRPLPGEVGLVHQAQIAGLGIGRVPSRDGCPAPLPSTEVCRFTSGSTGTPSCIEFTGTAVYQAARGWHEATGIEPDDVILCFAGLYNGLAFNTSLLAAFTGGAALWLPGGMPTAGNVARQLQESRATRLVGFPALYESLLRRDAPVPGLSALRVALSSGAPLRAADAEMLLTRQGLAVNNYYGVAETGPLTFDPDPAPDRGLGTPLPGVSLAGLGDDSGQPREILVRSASMGSRYLNAPGAFESRIDEQGFYHTGDEGYLHEGRLYLAGRLGKGLNIGGRKLDAEEIRGVLLEVDGVHDAVVFAVTRSNGDRMLGAVVAGGPGVTEAALRACCRERLAPYKTPERCLIVDSLPRTGIGKLRPEQIIRNFEDTVFGGAVHAARPKPATAEPSTH
jgi:acyl-CoA synthetase (AMP-forming)/AMP-acid ligase II